VRIVFDSNVLLAAFGTRGMCETVLQIALAAHGDSGLLKLQRFKGIAILSPRRFYESMRQ
jgi:predicted nucleic acid-binding protein